VQFLCASVVDFISVLKIGAVNVSDDRPSLETSRTSGGGLRAPLLVLAVWVALGVVDACRGVVATELRGYHRSWGAALVAFMPWWLLWALLTPVALWLARRAPLDQRRWLRSTVVHAAGALALSVVHLACVGAMIYYTTAPPAALPNRRLIDPIRRNVEQFLVLDLLTYAAIVVAYFALDYYRRYRESAIASARLQAQAAQLEARVAEARLHALRMELNPHFLFNALNAISGLVRTQETDAAVRMLAQLGDLLRSTLDRGAAPEMPLHEELELLQRYLDIERVRFGGRLAVEVSVAPGAEDALVPTLVLQPLVENAVRHGVASRPGPALIRVGARREGAALLLEVRDTGGGVAAAEGRRPPREGVGLSNTRARLEQLYGPDASLDLRNADGGGALAAVRLPFHTEPRLLRATASA